MLRGGKNVEAICNDSRDQDSLSARVRFEYFYTI